MKKAGAISIHALHAEGDAIRVANARPTEISIHALHAEGDVLKSEPELYRRIISIHALHAEGDARRFDIPYRTMEFQSTPSMRRATLR